MTQQEQTLPQNEQYKVWVDGSSRTCPKFFNLHAKKAEEAIALILTGKVSHISLGQTLAGQVRNVVDVAEFIETHAKGGGYRFNVVIHEKTEPVKRQIMNHLKSAMRSWIGKKVETVQVDYSNESWFAIMAMCLANQNATIPDTKELKIQFTVNGKELSFVDTVRELHQRMTSHVQELAAKMAYERMCAKFLKIDETLKTAERSVKEKIYEQFGIPLNNTNQ